ncbi:MAG: sensor histidine kinase [Trueperaceae bacterium]
MMHAHLTNAWRRFAVPRPAALWLIYLVMLVFQPAFDSGRSAVDWLTVAAMVVVFVPLYGWTVRHTDPRPYFWRRGPGALVGIAAMTLMGLFLSAVNSGAAVFFVYAAATAGRIRPRRRALQMIAGIAAVTLLAVLISPIDTPYRWFAFAPVIVFAPLLGFAGIYETERARANAKLRMAHGEIEHLATIAERERIARDLHDLLGHTLSTITLKSELAARLAKQDPARAEQEMRDVERISRDALAQVRIAVRGYRSHGLQGEMVNAKLALEAAGVRFDYFVAPLRLTTTAESVLSLALREGITNVMRHAHARTCQVRLERDGPWIRLRIEDDGIGAERNARNAGNPRTPRDQRDPTVQAAEAGSGIDAMRERVRAFGGHVALVTSAGTRSTSAERPSGGKAAGGTRLDVTLPAAIALRNDTTEATNGDKTEAAGGAHPARANPMIEASAAEDPPEARTGRATADALPPQPEPGK